MFYIESGTGRQIDASNLAAIDPSKTYFLSTTGQSVPGSQLVTASRPAPVIAPALSPAPAPVPPAPAPAPTASANNVRTAVQLGNGQTVFYDNAGNAYDAGGAPVTQATIAASTRTAAPAPAATTNPADDRKAQLDALLANPSLTSDQKAVIQSIYDAVSTNDTNKAAQITAAMQAATQYSEPYFKAQARLAVDALTRGLSMKDGDLAFQETSLNNALTALQTDVSASKDNLSLQHAQELKQLADKFETDLDDTRTNLAAAGFTDSSKRVRTEEILNNNNNGLVETSNRNFAYQTGQLDRSLQTKQTDTALEIANLRRLADAGKLDLTRQTEEKVGSTALSDLGYPTLGNVGGTIPYNQAKDALGFANSFVA